MKIMAVDYGEKRVGIASTDESGEFALPRVVLENKEDLAERVLEFANDNKIEKIVIGESKNFAGEPNPLMLGITRLKEDLQRLGQIEVVLHPEALTTIEASHIQGRGGMIDASAAAIILKSYIDGHN